ncbi:MAG: tRNA pseudouridine(54/55) synthase Pus10 [archaeon]
MARKMGNPYKHTEHHMSSDFKIEPLDFVFEGIMIEKLMNKIKELTKDIEYETFKLGAIWYDNEDKKISDLRREIQGRLIFEMRDTFGKKPDFSNFDLDILVDFAKEKIFIKIAPAFVKGKYCKFSRSIAQTEYFCNKCKGLGCWYCKGTGHFSEESVEQLMGQVMVKYFKAKGLVIHGAGREDMDVLMLGKGRPFVAELLAPEVRHPDLKKIGLEINKTFKEKISINSLEFCTLNDVSPTKDDPHDKIYRAIVSCKEEPDLSKLKIGQEMKVIQKTPTRVAKRRANLDRAKKVTILKIDQTSKKELVIELKTSHGTYVKEFISGDAEKTKPSIAAILGIQCECEQLDVVEICS